MPKSRQESEVQERCAIFQCQVIVEEQLSKWRMPGKLLKLIMNPHTHSQRYRHEIGLFYLCLCNILTWSFLPFLDYVQGLILLCAQGHFCQYGGNYIGIWVSKWVSHLQGNAFYFILLLLIFILSHYFWVQNWLCSRLAPASVLKCHSWQA